MHKTVIEVVRSPLGWWDVWGLDGRVTARYVSEFQAWEAGRALAEQCGADLLVRPEHGPVKREAYDAATRTLRPSAEPSTAETPNGTVPPPRSSPPPPRRS